MYFTLVKKTYPQEDIIVRVLKDLIKEDYIKTESSDMYLVIYHNFDNLDSISLSLETLSNDMLFKLYAYNSLNADDKKLKEELEIAKGLLDGIPVGCYNLKSAILKNNNISDKKTILNFILDGTGISEFFINGYVDANLNVSYAAEILFLHRNTMLYKLNKLKELKGFDLRVFKDIYIIYNLMMDK